MGITIRRARKKDFPQILSLLSLLSATKPNQAKALKIFKKIFKSQSYFIFVACNNKNIVGTASIFIGPSLQHGKLWGLIDNVVVAKDFRRDGIGRQLVNTLVDLAKEKDCYKIILTSRFNRPRVHKFWQKLGFKKHGYSFRIDL